MIRNVKGKSEISLYLSGCRQWLIKAPFLRPAFLFFSMGQPDDQAARHPFAVWGLKCHWAFWYPACRDFHEQSQDGFRAENGPLLGLVGGAPLSVQKIRFPS
jgi:hypothetical protein